MTNPDNVGGLQSANNPALLPGVHRLWDSQWCNIVNHDDCYRDYTKEEAVAMAVRLTEKKMAENAELCRAAPAGGDDQKEYEMDKTIYDLAIHCGAHVDGGEYQDHSANFAGSPPTIEFTDRQLEKFVEKIIDGSWLYKGFVKDERPLTASDLRDM